MKGQGVFIKTKVKNNLYVGSFINCMLFAATTPLVNLFFMQKVSGFIFSIVNLVSIVTVLIMNKLLKSKSNRSLLERLFLQIIILDTFLFLIISAMSEHFVNIRFFGLAVLNGTTAAIWLCIVRSNINKVFSGEELTDFQTHQEYLSSISQLIGASLAVALTKIDIGITALMFIQIIASVIMGYFDYKTIKIVRKYMGGL